MRAVILHGTASNHTGNWFPWLKKELEKLGYKVWVPDLPLAERPNVDRYTKFLLGQDWDFNQNLVIGHSAGAVELLDLVEKLPADTMINTAILVAVFQGDLGWEALKDLGDLKFNLEKIRKKAKKFIVVHSEDDPYCPVGDAREVAEKLHAEFVPMDGMKHFSLNTNPKMERFPELLAIIKKQVK